MTGVRPCELVRAADGRSSPQVDEFADSNASVLVRGVCDRRWLAGRGTSPGISREPSKLSEGCRSPVGTSV